MAITPSKECSRTWSRIGTPSSQKTKSPRWLRFMTLCRMNILVVFLIGALMGGLNGVGIFFEPREPYKIEILLAATLKGVLISLLTGFSLGPSSSWLRGAGFGMLYGFAFGLVIFLAKGAFKSKDAPYVVPMSIVTGLITGVLLAKLAF